MNHHKVMDVIKTELCDMLEIKYPIIQAGMGPLSTNEICIAAANTGLLGLISSSGLFSSMYGPQMYEVLTKSVGADPDIDQTDLLREIYYKVQRETKESGGIFGTNVMVSAELRGGRKSISKR
jgi:Dioxygenases related to 2-nitropropane dioxygenase